MVVLTRKSTPCFFPGERRARTLGLQEPGVGRGQGHVNTLPCLTFGFLGGLPRPLRRPDGSCWQTDRDGAGGAGECLFVPCAAARAPSRPTPALPGPPPRVITWPGPCIRHPTGGQGVFSFSFFTSSENTHATFNRTSISGTAWFSASLSPVLAFYADMFWGRRQLGERVLQ